MKTVIYTSDANPAVYCETHIDVAIAKLAEASIAYSAESETTNAECITCMQQDSLLAIYAAKLTSNTTAE